MSPSRRDRRGRTTLISLRTGKPLQPVATMTAAALHDELVEDACAGVSGGEPYLKRQIAAYMRIAKLRHVNPDTAFEAVRDECIARTGIDMLDLSARL